MLPVRYARLELLTGWVMVLVVIVVCLVPQQELPKTGLSDKTEHFIAFCGLMLWFAGLYPRSRYLLIAGVLFVLAVAIEVAQHTMGLGRHGDVMDVVADSIGIVLGLVLAYAGLGRWAQWIDGWTRNREPARTD